MKWFKVAESIAEITRRGERTMVELSVAGRQVCLAVSNDEVFCCAAKCPHAGARLCQGFLDARQNIVCPLHQYRFQLTTGRNTSGEGYHLKTYPVKVDDDGVYIAIS